MKPKLKRKKYKYAGGVENPYETQAFVTDEYGNQIATNTEAGAALQASQTNTLSGIGTEGVGSAVPSTSANASSGNTMGSILSMAGGTALSATTGGKNKNSAIQSAYKTPLYRAADVAVPGLGIGLQVADVGINAASKGIANQFSDQTTMGRAVKKGQKWSEWGVDPSTKMMLGEIGAGVSLLTDKKQKQKLEREESDKAQVQKDYLSMQQSFADQLLGTQQTNPVYGMKDGGSLYSMGNGGLNNHDSGIVKSSKNGVDKTKASMPEGAFVIPANKREQAIKDGILENKPISPNQGGVPIMISGGEVDNPNREGVIMPGKVKQLLAMGVDLDKYAPNADHSLYDIAGTRKNVMHGGMMHYDDGGGIGGGYEDPNKPKQPLIFRPKENKTPWIPDVVQDALVKQQMETEQNTVPYARNYMAPMPSMDLRTSDPWHHLAVDISKDGPEKAPVPYEKPSTKKTSTPWTDEQKSLAIAGGLGALGVGVQGAEALWNLTREYKPMPMPIQHISQTYTPNVSAMDAYQKQQSDIARATALYNARQAGLDQGMITAIHANEMAGMNQYNAQRQGMLEQARQANIAQANQDRAAYEQALYGRNVGDWQAKMQFQQNKAAALGENISGAMKELEKVGAAGQEYYMNQSDSRAQQHQNAINLAYQLNAKPMDIKDYRRNRDGYDGALRTLNNLKVKNPTKYSELAPKIAGMDVIDAANYMSTQIQ